MKSHKIFEEYEWLVDTIRRAGRITFKDLSDLWERSCLNEHGPLPRTTFNRHRETIKELFGFDIKCDRSNGNVYYIANLHQLDSIKNWMVSALAVRNLIAESHTIQNRILLEPIPFSGETLHHAVCAMKENRVMELTYRGYEKPERIYIIEPYFIRLYRQRWYVLGHFENKFRLFSFDRIVRIKTLNRHFKMPDDFDCEAYFNEYFGIVADEQVMPRRVVIRAHGLERYYLRDLPLHHTQHEIGSTADSTDFELYLRPTDHFIDAIFARGGTIEIISPQSLKEELLQRTREMLRLLTC